MFNKTTIIITTAYLLIFVLILDFKLHKKFKKYLLHSNFLHDLPIEAIN